jgi:ElaB/YqjD/DUF883 family membrane-anchored ribosome-binding protein
MAIENEPEAIRQQMDETRSALNDKIATLEQQVVDTVQGASAGVMETVEVLKDAVHDTVQNVRDSVGETVDNVRDTFSLEKQMENRPWAVLAISVGLGFAAGYLVTPPRRASRRAHGPEGFSFARPQTHDAFAGYEPLAAAQPSTSSNGAGRSSQETRSEPTPAAPAATSAPAAPSGPGILDNLTHAFEGEISVLKGLAVGALGGMVRDIVVPQIPEAFKEKVQEIIDGVTTKLGGEPVRGPIFGEEKHEGHEEHEGHPEPFGSRMGSRS